jgi:hypothetical protein
LLLFNRSTNSCSIGSSAWPTTVPSSTSEWPKNVGHLPLLHMLRRWAAERRPEASW